MFGVRKVYEARIADLKEAHESERKEMLRTIDALAEQIEFLRAQLGSPKPQPGLNPSNQPMRLLESDPFVGEDEEAILEAHAQGVISDEQLSEALQQVGFLNQTVEFTQ